MQIGGPEAAPSGRSKDRPSAPAEIHLNQEVP